MHNLEIVPFDFTKHLDKVHELWQAALGDSWPLSRETFAQLLDPSRYNAGLATYSYVALVDDALVGFVTAQISKAATISGIINLILVLPQFQRQGIGFALHKYVMEQFKEAGVTKGQLGGGVPTIWQGVPVELTEATAFFNKMGWEFSEKSFDLIQDLQTFQNPQDFIDPVKARGISFNQANPNDKEAIVAFQREKFPRWLIHYEKIMELGDYEDILLARDAEGGILGMLIMYSSSSNSQRLDVVWKEALGENAGALGCVGVAHKAHRQGLGTAMMAYANDLQKARGVGNCFISWTWRVSFYERVSYKLWKSYHMSWRSFA